VGHQHSAERGVRLLARRPQAGGTNYPPEFKLAGKPLDGAVANWVTFTEDGKTIYNSGLRSVTAIDTASMKIKAVIPVGEVPKRINTLVMN
jgi:hypothetical protein